LQSAFIGAGLLACPIVAGCIDHKAEAGLPPGAVAPLQAEPVARKEQKVAAQRETPSPAASELAQTCRDICQNSRRLNCKHADECPTNCFGMGSIPSCQAQFAAFYRCLVAQPSQNWRCDDDGVASIREGFCDREQQQAIECVEAHPPEEGR
jgi:hypothetical protein